jgi:hypothetical protein
MPVSASFLDSTSIRLKNEAQALTHDSLRKEGSVQSNAVRPTAEFGAATALDEKIDDRTVDGWNLSIGVRVFWAVGN